MKNFTLSLIAIALVSYGQAQIVDPGFEGGPGAYWGEFSTNFGTPLCDASCGINAYDGDWYSWFGGAPDNADFPELGWLYQDIQIPNGAVGELSFYCAMATAGTSEDDFVDVYLDNTLLFSITPADSADFAGWVQVLIDVSSWTDNQMHELQLFGSEEQAGGSSILFDLFSLVVDETEYTGVFESINREVELSVFPNPVSDILNLQFNSAEGSAVVNIMNMNGEVVSTQQLSNIHGKTFRMDTSVLASGIYNVSVDMDGNTISQRIVVSH